MIDKDYNAPTLISKETIKHVREALAQPLYRTTHTEADKALWLVYVMRLWRDARLDIWRLPEPRGVPPVPRLDFEQEEGWAWEQVRAAGISTQRAAAGA